MADYIPEIKFDPNSANAEQFATYRPRRTPKFKLHSKLGNAQNAARQGGPSIVYRLQGGRWVTLEEDFKNVACTICGEDYRKAGPYFVPEETERTSISGRHQHSYTITTKDGIWDTTRNQTAEFHSLSNTDRGAHESCVNRAEHMSRAIKNRLAVCIGADTAVDYEQSENSDNIWRGQCVPVALIVNDELGGDIMRSEMPNGESHYWNKVDIFDIDLTGEQYEPEFDPSMYRDNAKKRTREYLLGNADTRSRYETLRALYDMIKT